MTQTMLVGHKCLDGAFWQLIASDCRMNPFHMQFRVQVPMLNVELLRPAFVKPAASSLVTLASHYRLCYQSGS